MKIQPSFFFPEQVTARATTARATPPPTADERDNEESDEEEAQGLDSPPLASTTATGVSGGGAANGACAGDPLGGTPGNALITNSDAKPTLGSGGCLAQAVAVVTEEPYQKVLDGLDAQIPNVAAAGGTSVAGDCWTPAVVLAYYKHCYSGGNFSWGHVDKTSIMPRLTEDQIAALSPGELNKELVKHDIAKLRNRKKPTIRKAG